MIKLLTDIQSDPIAAGASAHLYIQAPPGYNFDGGYGLTRLSNLTLICSAPEGATSGVVSVRIGLQWDKEDIDSRENYARADFPFDKGADISGCRPGPWVFGEGMNTYPGSERAFIDAIRSIPLLTVERGGAWLYVQIWNQTDAAITGERSLRVVNAW